MVLCVRWHLKVRKFRNLEAQSWRVGRGWERGEVKENGRSCGFPFLLLPRQILIMQSKV